MPSPRAARRLARLEHAIFTALVLVVAGLLAWLSARYHVQMDWTAAHRNTLSAASRALVDRMPGPLEVTAYARDDAVLRGSIVQLVDRYRRAKPDVHLEFVDPDREPEKVRRLAISVDGELVIGYRGRTAHVTRLTEADVTNALHRLVHSGERWIAYLSGHGERDLLGHANFDLGRFGDALRARGYHVQPLVLGAAGEVPDNVNVLVVSEPEVALLPAEARALVGYVARGGSLLWLSDPRTERHLGALAKALGVSFVPGTIVDPGARLLGIDHPAVVVVTSYAHRGATRGFKLLTLFSHAAGIEVHARAGWKTTTLARTGVRTWSETGSLDDHPRFDAGADTPGPLAIAVAMRRAVEKAGGGRRTQRVVVVGDGDFLSNSYLGNGGNLDLGLGLVGWLTADDSLVDVPARVAPDLDFALSRPAALFIAAAALFGLPLAFLATGAAIWIARRRR